MGSSTRKSSRNGAIWRVSLLLTSVFFAAMLWAQERNNVIPNLVSYGGTLRDAIAQRLTSLQGVTFALYKEQQGGSPLWIETQNVQLDKSGHYTVMLGSATQGGLPASLFASGEARWLGVQAQGQAEQPRVMLLAVPYALKAGDAQTVGGLPASAFMLASPPSGSTVSNSGSSGASGNTGPNVGGSGTAGYLAGWVDNNGDLGNSAFFQSGSGSSAKIGLNLKNPLTTLDVNGSGLMRGFLEMATTGFANSSKGFNSNQFNIESSAYNSSTKKYTLQHFLWQAEPLGNNTNNPSATLNLLFNTDPSKPTETGLSISSQGLLTFAPGQTFPGTGNGTITGVTAGTDLTGGGTSGNVTLNLNTTATDARYAQLGVSNSFTGNETVSGNLTSGGIVQGAQGLYINSTGAIPLQAVQNDTSRIDNAIEGVIYSPQAGSAAVLGTSLAKGGFAHVYGVEGTVQSSAGVGVFGVNGAISGTGSFAGSAAGVWGDSGTIGKVGVLGSADSAAAVAAQNNSTTSPALYVSNNSQAGTAIGGEIVSNSPTGVGAYGVGTGPSNVFLTRSGAQSIGTVGDAGDFSSGTPIGVWGAADSGIAVLGENNSATAASAIFLNLSDVPANPAFEAGSDLGDCLIDAAGDLACTGTTSAVAPISENRWVKLYAVQSPENWFEDFGSGQLANGSTVVSLEKDFAETVNLGTDYHVFLTPNGNSRGLYVASKGPASFEVREQGGGKSNIAFDYRIVARRRGYEQVRLPDVSATHLQMTARVRKLSTINDPKVRPQLHLPAIQRPGRTGISGGSAGVAISRARSLSEPFRTK